MPRFPLVAAAIFACACVGAQPRVPVILISVDTLRADHLSCYQPGRPPTPHIDSLAHDGTLYTQASSLVPLTLPSHVAIFTSMYPFANGVEDNGIPFGPGETIATILKSAGYRTAAFVGGFVLDRRFGLSRGFDVYDSPFDLHRKRSVDAGDLKRPGAEVAAAAKGWLDRNDNSPFFLFLHLFDLHTPYDLPPGQRSRGQTGYAAELAYVDGVIGDFLAYLERRGLLKTALIVFTSDHGEGLGDHGESTHGYFVYQSTIRVPLIIHWPPGGKRLSNRRVDEPVSLLDIAPTILDSLGLPPLSAMQGRSLIAGKAGGEIFSESLYARNHFGCGALHALRDGRYKYIDAPKPELYDLAADPFESRNLYSSELSTAKAMRQRLLGLLSTARATKPKTPSADALKALRSLGYLGGTSATGRSESQVDPKDRIGDFELYGRASALATAGQLAESSRLLLTLARKLPDVADIRISLGLNLQQNGRYSQAAEEFQRALKQEPQNPTAHFDLALSEFQLQHFDGSIKELQAALMLEPWYTRAEELLITIFLQKRDYQRARPRLQHLLSIDPLNYTAHYNLGVLAAISRNWNEAKEELISALTTDPASAEAHNSLGSVYLELGQLTQARGELEEAVRLQPESASAHYNLALVLKRQQKIGEATQELREALKADPQFQAARRELDRIEGSARR